LNAGYSPISVRPADASPLIRTATGMREPRLPSAQITLLGDQRRIAGIFLKTIVRRQLRILGPLIYDHPTDFADTIALVTQRPPGTRHQGRVLVRRRRRSFRRRAAE
jgi:hypothetical protein